MAIVKQIYETSTMLGVLRAFEPVKTYFLDTLFNAGTVNSQDEWIEFAKLGGQRKIAPLVLPFSQGKPIFSEAAEQGRFKPSYIKVKDAVHPNRVLRKRPEEALAGGATLSPQAREDAIVADILMAHRDAVQVRLEWMAAEAALNGKITLEDDGYPVATVDFQRDPSHTIVLGAGSRWGENGVSILADLETWRKRVRQAKFGGVTNRITVGPAAWDKIRKDEEIKKQMDLNYRNSVADLYTSIMAGEEVEYVGQIAPGLPVYVYSGYYHDAAGNEVRFMDERDVLLSGPNFRGIRAFGAILDGDAGYQALSLFPKMWRENDPGVRQVMTQSSPLMVPLNPNCTLRARVVA